MFKNLFLFSLLFSFSMNLQSADQERSLSTEPGLFVQEQEVQPKEGFAHVSTQTEESTEYEIGFANGKTVGFHEGQAATAQEIIDFCNQVDREFQEEHDRRVAEEADSGTV